MCGKLSEIHCNALLVSNCKENVMRWKKIVGQIRFILFLAYQTFSPGLENKETSKCVSESFTHIMTYILCVENKGTF